MKPKTQIILFVALVILLSSVFWHYATAQEKKLLTTPKSQGLSFYDFSKQSQIRIDSGLSEKVSNNQKIFTSNRCDIYVKSIRDSVEVCVYFYSKDTLIINNQKIAFKNKYKP